MVDNYVSACEVIREWIYTEINNASKLFVVQMKERRVIYSER